MARSDWLDRILPNGNADQPRRELEVQALASTSSTTITAHMLLGAIRNAASLRSSARALSTSCSRMSSFARAAVVHTPNRLLTSTLTKSSGPLGRGIYDALPKLSFHILPLNSRSLHASPSNLNQSQPEALPPVLPTPAVGRWLLLSSTLVLGIIVVGGMTRLTESGLSITEWRPITGILPPLTHDEWLIEFEKYKATPEFKLCACYPVTICLIVFTNINLG